MKSKSLIALAAALAIIFAIPAASAFAATTVHVDKTAAGAADGAGCGTGANAPCLTIAGGIANATDGDTVQVAAGTYNEQVTITKGITLDGAGIGQTFINPPSHPLSQCPAASGQQPVVCVNTASGSVTVEGFTINPSANLNGAQDDGNDILGVYVLDTNATISDNDVEHARMQPRAALGGDQGGGAIRATNDDATDRTVVISGNTVNDYQKGGIVVRGAGLGFTISDNTVTEGPADDIAANGIEAFGAGSGTISGNSVSGNECNDTADGCGSDPLNDTQSGGILLLNDGTVTVSNNTISGNDVGIFQADCGAASGCTYNGPTQTTITGNTFTNNRYEGVYADAGDTTLTNNTISGSNIGVENASFNNPSFPDPGDADLNMSGNKITGNGTGIQIDQDQSGTNNPHLTANDNDLSNNTNGLTNNTDQTEDANNNLFSCDAGSGTQCVTSPGGGGVNDSSSLTFKVSASTSSIGINGQTSTITAELVDSNNNVVSGAVVPNGTHIGFATSLGNIPASATTTNGVATAVLTSGATAGTAHVSSGFDGQQATTDVTITGPVQSPPTLTLQIKAASSSIGLSGKADAITATVIDASTGHAATTSEVPDGTKIGFATSLGSIPATGSTTNGVATVTLTSGATAGTAIVAAGFDDQAVTTSVQVGPVSKPPTTTVTGALIVSGTSLRESKGGTISFTLVNPQSSATTASITLTAKIKGKTVKIASRKVTIAAHGHSTVKLKLSKAARKALGKKPHKLSTKETAVVASVRASSTFKITK